MVEMRPSGRPDAGERLTERNAPSTRTTHKVEIMSIQAGQRTLKKAYEQLQHRWQRTEEGWNDATRVEFARQYLEPLEPRVHSAISGMERMGAMIAQARRDCEDTGGP